MPIYTYRCESCGIQFDRQQRFSDQQLVVCPECGEPSLRKVYLPVGIVFKGSGFYATDNRSPSGRSRKSSSENGQSDSTKDSKKQESKGNGESKSDKPKSDE